MDLMDDSPVNRANVSRLYEGPIVRAERVENFESIFFGPTERSSKSVSFSENVPLRSSPQLRRVSCPSVLLTTSITTINSDDSQLRTPRVCIQPLSPIHRTPRSHLEAHIQHAPRSQPTPREASIQCTPRTHAEFRTQRASTVATDGEVHTQRTSTVATDGEVRTQRTLATTGEVRTQRTLAATDGEVRRERIKNSLSRLSESILSRLPSAASVHATHTSDVLTHNACVGTSFCVRRNSTGSLRQTIRPDTIDDHYINEENDRHTEDDDTSQVSSIRFVEHAPSGFVDHGTLRIHPSQLPRPSDVPKHTDHGPFRPSLAGEGLMNVFSHANAPGVQTQQRMWDTFLKKSKLVNEFADVSNRMPSVVFALRGLIRFGDGDYGSTRTDCLGPFIQILTGRHPVCETPGGMEAIESCCAVLALLAVHPLSRQNPPIRIRPKFEQILFAQNCIMLQQIFGILSQQVSKWIQFEAVRNPDLLLTNAAVGALLDIVFLHCVPGTKLRSAWCTSMTGRQTIPRLITMIGEKLPLQIAKCVAVLDGILDETPGHDSRETAQSLHIAISRAQKTNPPVASLALEGIKKWSPSSSTLFSTLFGTNKRSAKSSIYTEYKTLIR